jgi:uracil-DNA glycosylase family 4
MNNIETTDNVTVIHPIQADGVDQRFINNCINIARINAVKKQLFNNCCASSCGIYNNSVSKSVPNGSCNASIMLVDAFPSEYETFTGSFTDEKGYLLEEIIDNCKIKRSDIYCTTVIKCFNVMDTNENIISNCLQQYFIRELEIISPKKLLLTYSAFQACLKYNIVPHIDNINYFTKTNIVLCGKINTDMYVIYDFKNLSAQQKEALKQGMNYVLA